MVCKPSFERLLEAPSASLMCDSGLPMKSGVWKEDAERSEGGRP